MVDMSAPSLSRYAGDLYATDAHLNDLYTRAHAALEHLPRGTFISHHTAASLLGLWVPRSAQVHVTTPPSAGRPERNGVTIHRGHRDDWTVRLGELPVSAPVQVLIDLHRNLGLADLVPLIDSVLRRGYSDKTGIVTGLRHKNISSRALNTAIKLARSQSDSAMESKTRLLVRWAGFPEPAMQLSVDVPLEVLTLDERRRLREILGSAAERHESSGSVTFRIDLAYAATKLGIEYDGEHHLSPDQREYDEIRRAVLRRLGWTIVVVTSNDLMSHPESFLNHLLDVYVSLGGEELVLRSEWREYFVDWQRPDYAGEGGRRLRR